MPGNKYLVLSGGEMTEVAALQSSAGSGDAGKIPALDSSGRIDASMMPVGVGADVKALVASENLAAGDVVNIWNDSGTGKARKADASNGREVHGFVLAGVTATATATIYKEGTITGLSGLTPGAALYLSGSTPGALTATAPTTAGHISQRVGVAVSATEADFAPQRKVTLA